MATTDADVTAPDDRPYRERRMSLAAHLLELRKRLFIAVIGLVVGMVIAFFITDFVIELLVQPIAEVSAKLGDDFTRLAFTNVTGAFDIRLRISIVIGLILSAPVWIWQVWAFVMPGLTKREVKYTIAFMAAAIPLFFGGCAVALMLIPNVIVLMSSFVPNEQFASQFYEAKEYYDFVFKMITIVGVAFVFPVFLVALNLAGITTGKAIMKGWRIALVVSLLFGALASPPADMVTMLVLAGILVVLYLGAALLSMLFDRRKRKRNPELYPDVPA